jgi:predicted transcriptional regulator
MPRQKKDNESLNIRLDKTLSNLLTEYCKETGATKTFVVEKALAMYFEDYRKKQEYLKDMERKGVR